MSRRDRRTGPRTATLTAAATKIDLAKLKVPRTTSPGGWQEEAWAYHDTVPEVSFATTFTGTALAKLRLYAACYPFDAGPDAEPIPVTDPDSGIPTDIALAAQDLVTRIRSLSGGQPEILRELNINWEVAGECYLIAWAARPLLGDPPETEPSPEWWEIRSKDEVQIRDGLRRDGTRGAVMYVRSYPDEPPETQREVIDGFDAAIRLWQRHPRWSGLPHSAIKACLTELRMLQILSGQVQAEAMSRCNAGLLVISNEVEIDRKPVIDPDTGDERPVPSFQTQLAEALIAPITDPADPASVAPLVLKVPGSEVANTQHIALGRESTETEAHIRARLERLGHGLNLPPEVIAGHMQTTYANAEQIDQDTFDDYLEPRATLMVQGLTFAAVTPDLAAMFPTSGDVIARIFVWYDAAALVSDDAPAEHANDGWDRGTISDDAWRSASGFSASDAPDEAERAARLEWIAAKKPAAPGFGPDVETPAVPPAPVAIAASNGNGHRPVLAAARRNRTGSQLVAIDRNLRERLIVLSDATMGQALDRAGNRAVNKLGRSQKEAMRRVHPGHRVAHMGPVMLADAGIVADDLLADAFDVMRPQFMAWGAAAQADALDAVSVAVSGLTTAQRELIQARQAGSLDEAWEWLSKTLGALAQARMFNPHPDAPTLGEVDATMRVPAGILRSAMAQAGGATGLQIDEGRGVWLPLNQGGNRPAGGVATGEEMTSTLLSNGAGIEGYEWVYGPAHRTRPFDPHVQLDGVEFENFDDPVLANNASFPEYAYFMPGDHPGCICDYEPTILPAP